MTQVSEKDFKTYKQGVYYLNKNDLENAYYNFSAVSKTSAIYEIALLRQALCADELNDYSTATKKFRMYIEKYPDSIFVQKAYYALAQNHFKEKDYNKAEKTFNDIKKLFKDTDYKTAADYYLGEICLAKAKEETDGNRINDLKQKAKKYFIDYLSEASGGRFSLECAKNILTLGVPITKQDYFLVGEAYFKNGLYKQAVANLNLADLPEAWGYLSLAYKYIGDYKKSRDVFEVGYAQNSDKLDESLLQKVIDNYADIHRSGVKSALYSVLDIAEKNSCTAADYVLYSLIKYENGQTKNNLYRKIYTEFPQGKFSSDAVANLFWDAYQRRDYQESRMLGQIHVREYQNTLAAPKILFWMAKLSEQRGNRTEARAFYQRILEKYPDDYYAYRANKYLNPSQNNSWRTKASHRLPEKLQIIQFPAKHANLSDDSISLIENILKLNDYKLLAEIDKNNKAVQSWINYKEGNFAVSARLARDVLAQLTVKPDFDDSLYKLAYPLHYQEIINNNARLYRLDPYLVVALIREESYFNTQAGSSVGAKGLMQLMPATASFIANRNGLSYSSLANQTDNIKLGCAYLDFVRSQLFGEDLFAVAAYNGGPNAVKIWQSKKNYKSYDEFIENIPYPETRDYVKKVYRSYWVYLNIY